MTDENLVIVPGSIASRTQLAKDVNYLQAGLYLQHVPTGLFAYGAYGKEDGDVVYGGGVGAMVADGDHWYVKGGIRQKWTPLGHTVLYGEYGQMDDMINPTIFGAGARSTELTKWGLGVVQEIDAAAMSLWLSYRQYDGEAVNAGGVSIGALDTDVHYVKAGALINF